MDFNQEYDRIMADHSEIALATCTDGNTQRKNRHFCCDPNRKGLIYFSTFRENRKGQEIAQNPLVAFTTIPHGGNSMSASVTPAPKSAVKAFTTSKRLSAKNYPTTRKQ
jgi:general stress protein 26